MCCTSAQFSAVHISTEQRRAIFTFDAVKSQFDQFVGLEATVDLRQDGWRQSFLADGDDGIQMMRGGAKGAALGGPSWVVFSVMAGL
jgi:hypothetical protein